MTAFNSIQIYDAKAKEARDAEHQSQLLKTGFCGWATSISSLEEGLGTVPPPSTPTGKRLEENLQAIERNVGSAADTIGCAQPPAN